MENNTLSIKEIYLNHSGGKHRSKTQQIFGATIVDSLIIFQLAARNARPDSNKYNYMRNNDANVRSNWTTSIKF